MTYNFQNIPDELKRLPQWVVWKYEEKENGKPTKVLYNPNGGWKANHSDARTWADYDNAVAVYNNGNSQYSGIGFVFSAFDEYCGVDLDPTDDQEAYARQVKIYEALNSYSELSPSGKGLHIIVKASVPQGRKRSFIEVYSQQRFFTFTGNVYRAVPIENRQEIVIRLWEELGNKATEEYFAGDISPAMFDDELIPKIETAYNGQQFKDLFYGNWQPYGYPSQSEADQALMNFIVFHTKNKAQAFRLFRMSALGQRDKAQRDKYLDYTFQRAMDLELPPIDMTALLTNINTAIQANKQLPQPQQRTATPERELNVNLDMWRTEKPPGLMGAMHDFFMARSAYPVHEISLAACLGLMAGVCGRAYNVNDSGLNLYLMLLAETGAGKDAMNSGVKKLIGAVSRQKVEGQPFEAAWGFLGPATAVSGPGLLKHLAKQPVPSYVSITGEVGKRLQTMNDKNANGAEKTFAGAVLALYTAAEHGNLYKGSSYSQEKDNVGDILAPAFSWLGEGEPIGFYETLSEANLSDGLLPRFIIIEYDGEPGVYNKNKTKADPTPELLSKTTELMLLSLSLNHANDVIVPTMSNGAEDRLFYFLEYCNYQRRAFKGTPLAHLWNRAHLNIWRVSALLAISYDMHQPIIVEKMIDWAASLVLTNTIRLVTKFQNGSIGGGEMSKALAKISRVVVSYFNGGTRTKGSSEANYINSGAISRSMFARSVSTVHPFKDDKNMLTNAISELVKLGALNTANGAERVKTFGTHAEIYYVSDMQWFIDHSS